MGIRDRAKEAAGIREAILAAPNVAGVSPPVVNAAGGTVVFSVVPATSPQSARERPGSAPAARLGLAARIRSLWSAPRSTGCPRPHGSDPHRRDRMAVIAPRGDGRAYAYVAVVVVVVICVSV